MCVIPFERFMGSNFMVRRLMDIVLALVGLVFSAPILGPVMVLIWAQDKGSPLYVAPRTGRDGNQFSMIKLRSMITNADVTGVDSTGSDDDRITPVGQFVRKYKLDELTQLWNVLMGDMSLVGPRPNVKRETDLYTEEERQLLLVRPGIIDYASVVFADEGEILKNQDDPDIAYHQLIRPGKSELGIFYVKTRSFLSDMTLIYITILGLFNRTLALRSIGFLLRRNGAHPALIRMASREQELVPKAPPGAANVVTCRDM